MVNIIDDDIWNPEPVLRPEDEIILRKLHEMLQSTADDLKLLSGELARHREPGVQVRSQPTPFDEEFNEKVYIEEMVNAKFHGHKIIDKKTATNHTFKIKDQCREIQPLTDNNVNKNKVNAGVQVNAAPTFKKTSNKNCVMTRPKVIQINEKNQIDTIGSQLNNTKINNKASTMAYREFTYKYTEPIETVMSKKVLQVQEMPSINIRSELTERKVLQLDILPENQESNQVSVDTNNVAVIAMQHEPPVQESKPITIHEQKYPPLQTAFKPLARKISKMSPCESSGSTNNTSTDTQHKPKLRKQIKVSLKSPLKSLSSTSVKGKSRPSLDRKQFSKKSQSNLDEWKKKINSIYGQPTSSRKNTTSGKSKTSLKSSSTKVSNNPSKSRANILNNKANYIPYSQLTLGGVKVSDIEKEISDIPNKHELPLSPILDRILSSRENSFHRDSPRNNKEQDGPKVLTTSDENLLQEVIDIERTVSETLSQQKGKHSKSKKPKSPDISSDTNNHDEVDSYADDFEDEKSEADKETKVNFANDSDPKNESIISSTKSEHNISDQNNDKNDNINSDAHNITYTKKINLSFKNEVDIFEFVHSVDTQDIATQSSNSQKISLKETQTSPKNDRTNIQPIHNDLWPPMDPKGEVEKMFKLEKDFIKKLIIEEYGDILEKNITKPSSSKNIELADTHMNVVSFQKNTQTSPAHVKCVMTSPTRTKTRPTSPFTLTAPVDRQTSPMICITSEEEVKVEIENEVEDLGISINLSSPRFSLRLPQTSREVLSNFETSNRTIPKTENKADSKATKLKTFRKCTTSSSSSVGEDNSSSEISSLGEIKLKLKRRLKKSKVLSLSDSSSTSIPSKYSSDLQSVDILPLKSEGEISLGQTVKKKSNKRAGSDGELSVGRLSWL